MQRPHGEKELDLRNKKENSMSKRWTDLCDECREPCKGPFLSGPAGHLKSFAFQPKLNGKPLPRFKLQLHYLFVLKKNLFV